MLTFQFFSVFVLSIIVGIFAFINLFTAITVFFKRSSISRYCLIVWMLSFQTLTVIFEIFVLISWIGYIFENHMPLIWKPISIIALTIFYVVETVILVILVKVCVNMDDVNEIPYDTVKVSSIMNLLNFENNVGRSTTPMEETNRHI